LTGARHSRSHGTDGCGFPSYAVPLTALARGFARLGSGQGLGPKRAEAAGAHPQGPSRAIPSWSPAPAAFDTRVMGCSARASFIKTGAEGVYCGAIPARARHRAEMR